MVLIQASPLYISVITAKPDPPNIYDWDVPILMVDTNHGQGDELNPDEWDLTTQQLLPHINGVFHIAKIANRAGKSSKVLFPSKILYVHMSLPSQINIMQPKEFAEQSCQLISMLQASQKWI